MKTNSLIVMTAVLSMISAAHAYDCQTIDSGIGDLNLLTLGGFTFAKPISVDLKPKNAPNAGIRYSIRCQVVYEDKNLQRPETDEEVKLARETGSILNELLLAFVADQYIGAEFSELLSVYYARRFTDDLNEKFQDYVTEKISAMDVGRRINISTVTVTVNAEGEFRAGLAELKRQQEVSRQN